MKHKIKNIAKIIISIIVIVVACLIVKTYAGGDIIDGDHLFDYNNGDFRIIGVGRTFCGNHSLGLQENVNYRFYGRISFEFDHVQFYGPGRTKFFAK